MIATQIIIFIAILNEYFYHHTSLHFNPEASWTGRFFPHLMRWNMRPDRTNLASSYIRTHSDLYIIRCISTYQHKWHAQRVVGPCDTCFVPTRYTYHVTAPPDFTTQSPTTTRRSDDDGPSRCCAPSFWRFNVCSNLMGSFKRLTSVLRLRKMHYFREFSHFYFPICQKQNSLIFFSG